MHIQGGLCAAVVEERIGDLPRHKKALEQADAIIALGKIAGAVAPFLPEKVRASLRDADPKKLTVLRDEMQQLADLPDRFNAHFADRGWIAFEGISATTAEQAVALADDGRIGEAEQVLAEKWTTDHIRFHIGRLKRVDAFPARWQLAVDAEGLYGEGKYHACTLLVLAVMDGVVQETSAKYVGINQNFSAEKTILEAWDSIAGHSTGLRKLKQLMLTSRKKTNTEPLSVPYRHGIVHGMDVNFNSRLVAAKAWAALFAVGEWALLAQRKQLVEPEPAKPKSLLDEWKETRQTIQRTQELKDAIRDFKPRTLWQDGAIPPTGAPDDYGAGTPERALVQFLVWWQEANYGKMAASITQIGQHAASPGDLRTWFEGKDLLSFELTNVEDQALARSTVSVGLRVRGPRNEWAAEIEVAMIKKLESGTKEDVQTCAWTFTDYYQFAREPRAAASP